MFDARRVVISAFILMAIIFSGITVYSGVSYFQVYGAVRAFSVTIARFDLDIVDMIITTEVSIQNPSDILFDIFVVDEAVYSSGEYVLRTSLSRQLNPLPLPARQSVSLILTSVVPDTKIDMVITGLETPWQLRFDFQIGGPVVERFRVERWFDAEIRSL